MPVGNKIKETIALNLWMKSSDSNIKGITNQLWNNYLEKNKNIRNKSAHKKFLEILLINIIQSKIINAKLSISLDKNQYAKTPKRYKHECQRYSIVNNIISFLAKEAYIIKYKASKPITHEFKARRPAILPLEKLNKLIENIKPEIIENEIPKETIILRKKVKNQQVEIDYNDDSTIKSYRMVLDNVNNIRSKTELCLYNVPKNIIEQCADSIKIFSSDDLNEVIFDKNGKSGIIRLRKTYLRRIFNKDFMHNGRFNGGVESLIKKELRRYICVLEDGKPNKTIEIDFKAMHIALLYHYKLKKDYRDDPYLKVCSSDKRKRKYYKSLMLISINSENEKKAIKAFRKKIGIDGKYKHVIGRLTNQNIKKMLSEIKLNHSEVKDYLNTGIGLELMFVDSKIAERILKEFSKRNIWIGVVHDSFIVKKSERPILKDIMNKSYNAETGFNPLKN